MFKNILVPTTGTPADAAVFAAALLAARTFGAHLEFLHVRVDTGDVMMDMTAGGIGGGTAVQAVIDRIDATALAQENAARAAVEAQCAGADIAMCHEPMPGLAGGGGPLATAEFTRKTGSTTAWLAQYGRFADLVVMGRGEPDDGTAQALETALMDTGKPLLVTPQVVPLSLGRVVLIAWTDTAEAARAVTAALPFIARAERVVIASVGEDIEEMEANGLLLQRVLRWHNPAVTFRALLRDGGTTMEILHQEALSIGADLLVMGGYSHSPMREVLFGGVTRETLAGAAIPVLLAH